ncbi:MAG: PD40 domain-containing protein [Bacteroidia bacterium]|nr:PD40 domain-containing protein [Bacteroidia bacterium]
MAKKILYLLVMCLVSFNTVNAQKKNVIEKSEDEIKMFNAQQSFYAGDFQKALSIYKDVLAGKPNDANVMGRIAECHFEMKQYSDAQEIAEKAKSVDEKAYENTALILGKIYHMNGKLTEAAAEYAFYKALVGDSKKAEDAEIDRYIKQVNTAKELIEKPANVTVVNMGDNINSEYDDKAPMVSADGKTLIFTSRRPGKTSALDKDGDNGYFEDIYISKWDTTKKAWGNAELIPGSINTDGHDACTSLSPDGKQIYLYKNDIEAESRGGDIYVSKISSSGKWGAPRSMGKPINTTYWEGGGCISPDGKSFYFISERKGGFGHGDIYVLKKKTKSEWEKTPVNIGADINTPEDEGGLFLAPDGKTLFFTSKGHNSMGGYDIFKTVNENGKWSTPVNLGYPINTVKNDYCFSLSVDAQTGYFTSDRTGGFGERDLYKVDLANYPVLEKDMKPKAANGPVMAILKGDVFDATAGTGMEAEILILDETGAKVASTNASEGSGEYFITLLANKTYQIKIEVKGYKPIDEKVEIKAAKEGATTVVKHYLLYKK